MTTQTAATQFLFTAEQEDYRARLRAFGDTFADGYHERALSTEFFWDVYEGMADQGVLGLSVPRELGGQGETAITSGIAMEEIAHADFNAGFALFGALCTNALLAEHASPEVRDSWLPRALAGKTAIGLALTELVAGSDARGIQTRATKVDGGWTITGHKTSSGFTMVAGATIVFARTGDGPKDITAFLVPLDSAGVDRERIPSFGFRPTGRGKIGLSDVFVPEVNVVGQVGQGFGLVMEAFDYTRAILALLGVGTATRALDVTIDFVSERETFGQKLATRQGATFPIAEHLTVLESVRWMAYHTLALKDAGLPHTKEAAMVKWYGTKASVDAVRDAIVLLGHRGYSEELPLMQMMRDLAGLEIADGAPQIQKMIITREVFGRSHYRRGTTA
ncbi:acyl-CoA dehydrogenase family protein [Georgenia sp. H159]|uniref:acyl-CoA dehydrogenase family protein n=1 Tax=Georgenia sp. H159 TaxID=3076115 RepID=UPI002D79B28A|nr:acyl-CoA dehydrogenase family protein [Georgenia sp. H159]